MAKVLRDDPADGWDWWGTMQWPPHLREFDPAAWPAESAPDSWRLFVAGASGGGAEGLAAGAGAGDDAVDARLRVLLGDNSGHILGTLRHKPGESQRITMHVISQVNGSAPPPPQVQNANDSPLQGRCRERVS